MSEREHLQAQAEALQETAKTPSSTNRTRIADGLRRYLAAEARRTRRVTKKEDGGRRKQ